MQREADDWLIDLALPAGGDSLTGMSTLFDGPEALDRLRDELAPSPVLPADILLSGDRQQPPPEPSLRDRVDEFRMRDQELRDDVAELNQEIAELTNLLNSPPVDPDASLEMISPHSVNYVDAPTLTQQASRKRMAAPRKPAAPKAPGGRGRKPAAPKTRYEPPKRPSPRQVLGPHAPRSGFSDIEFDVLDDEDRYSELLDSLVRKRAPEPPKYVPSSPEMAPRYMEEDDPDVDLAAFDDWNRKYLRAVLDHYEKWLASEGRGIGTKFYSPHDLRSPVMTLTSIEPVRVLDNGEPDESIEVMMDVGGEPRRMYADDLWTDLVPEGELKAALEGALPDEQRSLMRQRTNPNQMDLFKTREGRKTMHKALLIEGRLYRAALATAQRLDGRLPPMLAAAARRFRTAKTASSVQAATTEVRKHLDLYLERKGLPVSGESWATLAELAKQKVGGIGDKPWNVDVYPKQPLSGRSQPQTESSFASKEEADARAQEIMSKHPDMVARVKHVTDSWGPMKGGSRKRAGTYPLSEIERRTKAIPEQIKQYLGIAVDHPASRSLDTSTYQKSDDPEAGYDPSRWNPHGDVMGHLPSQAEGYPLVYYTGDGSPLCADCATAELDEERGYRGRGGDLEFVDTYWEGPTLFCENCNAELESAYGDPDEPEGEEVEASKKRRVARRTKKAAGGLDTFTRAYIEAALFAETDNSDESGGEPLDRNYGIEDIAPECLAQMRKDCDAFSSTHWDMIAADEERAGHDFWLTRNGHGAGFWDGDWPEDVGDALTEASKAFGEVNLYVGDDGLIYCM